MADAADDLFLFDDDFEAILDILDEDEALQEQFSTVASEVQSTEIVCSDCGKKYKSRGGYQRHRATKHNSNQNSHHLTLTPNILAEILSNALKSITEREVFAADIRNEFKQYEYEEPGGDTQEFTVIKKLFEDYLKHGNAEKFYGNYYAQVPLKPSIFFKGLSRNVATLLAAKKF